MKFFFTLALMVFALDGCNGNDGRSTSSSNGNGGKKDMTMISELDLSEPPIPGEDGFLPQPDDAGLITHDPVTCAEAAMTKSYIGCDYWPTVNMNAVWSVFDFAVVISNPGMTDAHVTITGGALPTPSPSPSPTPITKTVPAGQLIEIGLPWVSPLKGNDATNKGIPPIYANSVLVKNGAYHLVSDLPVLVYQFNALEYKPGTGNDLNGIPWSTCPGTGKGTIPPCLSYSNDASLLLPSTAMTGNYIATGVHGDNVNGNTDGPHMAITAVADNTMVTIKLSGSASVLASTDGKVTAANSGAKVSYSLNAGDVLQLVAKQSGTGSDLTGSQIQASNPVQVISGHPCMPNPQNYSFPDQYSCDHVEESQLPLETWGKSYVVNSPTGPNGTAVAQTVRIYGGQAASTLTVTPPVAGGPTMVAANGVAEFDASTSFVITGTNEFAVGVIQKSGQIVDPTNLNANGDPSLSFISATAQYRDRYIFLAPSDYAVNFADVVVPMGTTLMLDGAAVTQTATSIGGGFGVVRIPLTTGANGGAHVMTGNQPFGLQVEGYGAQTSYQYPAGLDLKVIAPSPSPIG
jgi:IgGFc binding protein